MRSSVWLIATAMVLPRVVPAQEPGVAVPDLQAWGQAFNVRPTVGFNDNLLLSDLNVEESYSVGGGIDATVWRLPVDDHQFLFMASGDYSYYPDGDEVSDEAFFFSVSQYQYDLNEDWRLKGLFQYVYLDQVLDVSTLEPVFVPLPVENHAFIVKPSVRGYLPHRTWIEVELSGGRQIFNSPLDDYWEGGPKLTLGKDYGHRSTVSVSYDFQIRSHDSRENNTTNFVAFGSTLKFYQHTFETLWKHNIDKDRHWRTATRLGYQRNEDNGNDFYQFDRYRASQELRWIKKPWNLKGQVGFFYYDFTDQAVSPADPSTRDKTTWFTTIRVERELAADLSVFTEYERETSLSNRNFDEYRVNQVKVGVDWEF